MTLKVSTGLMSGVVCFLSRLRARQIGISTHASMNNVTVEVMCLALGDTAREAMLYEVKGNAGMSTLLPWDKTQTFSSAAYARYRLGKLEIDW